MYMYMNSPSLNPTVHSYVFKHICLNVSVRLSRLYLRVRPSICLSVCVHAYVISIYLRPPVLLACVRECLCAFVKLFVYPSVNSYVFIHSCVLLSVSLLVLVLSVYVSVCRLYAWFCIRFMLLYRFVCLSSVRLSVRSSICMSIRPTECMYKASDVCMHVLDVPYF